MNISSFRLLNIRIFENGEIIYEGLSEDVPTEYKESPIKIIGTGKTVDVELINEEV